MLKLCVLLALGAVASAGVVGIGGHGGFAGHGGFRGLGGYGGHGIGYAAAPAIAVAAPVAPVYAHAPQPYEFGYNRQHEDGAHVHRQEVSDPYNNKKGSYGYTDPDGIYRHVDYVADELGFRANIRTNEPGTANQNPAAVGIDAAEPPYKVLPAPVVKAAVPILGHGGYGHGGIGHGVGLVTGGVGYGHGLARGVIGGYGLARGIGYGHGGIAFGHVRGYGLGIRGHGGFGHHG